MYISIHVYLQILDKLNIGDTVEVKGPVGSFVYSAPGKYTFKGKPSTMSRINMVAGGTGITPMYQVITAKPFRQHQYPAGVC